MMLIGVDYNRSFQTIAFFWKRQVSVVNRN
jgi:hypothetical protein